MAVLGHLLIVLMPTGCPYWDDDDRPRVYLITILATSRNDTVDPKLKELLPAVKQQDKCVTGLSLHRVVTSPVTQNEKQEFDLIETAKAEVTWKGVDEKTGRHKLTVRVPGSDDVCYGCCCQKYLPIFTKYVTKAGDRVVIGVMVRPCPAK